MPKFDDKGQWIEPTDQQVYRGARRWVIVAVAALVLLPAIAWGLSVLFSDVAGKGNQKKQINRAENRTFAQEMFRELYEDIQSYDTQITTTMAAAAAETDPAEKSRLNSVVLGVRNQCIATVRQYDAEAQKVSKERFRDADLPESIDTTDPSFDCKGDNEQ